MTTFNAPRETDELMPFEVTLDGAPVTEGIAVCIVPEGPGRPGTWAPATVQDGKTYARVAGLQAGFYRLYVQVTTGGETPVINCGLFEIS